MGNKNDLSTKLLATIGELAVIASLFPYQITINRKEKSFSARSLLLRFKSERTEDETGKTSRNITFRMPGFAFGEALAKVEQKLPKKEIKTKLVLRRKGKPSAQNEE